MATLSELSAFLGVTPRRVQQLAAEGMPRESRGRYSLDACGRWYVRHLQALVRAKHDPERRGDAVAFTRERTRLAREQADASHMRTVAAGADLVRLNAIQGEIAQFTNAIAAIWHEMADKAALACNGLDVAGRESVLATAMHEALDACARWKPGKL